MFKTNRLKRVLLFAVAIFIMSTMTNLQASAALIKCRTDPIFLLSNGDILNITLDISTDAMNVRNVTYVLHVPAAVTVERVTYTAGGLGTKEIYKVYQDSPGKTYTTDTLVTTQNTGSIPMIATTRLNSITAKSASGYSGTHLIVTVVKP